MIKIDAVSYDEDNNVDGGINFYWDKGNDQVLYQEWEFKASGPVWGPVNPDPMFSELKSDDPKASFIDYVEQCWQAYKIVDVTENYR